MGQKRKQTQNERKHPDAAAGKGLRPATKRWMIVLGVIALALILALAALLLLLPGGSKQPLDRYIAENWTVFRLRSWDEKSGALELDYPLRFRYEQMEKYGGKIEELRALPAGNYATAEALKAAARTAAGAEIRSVTVYGLTTDEKTAYTVYPDGTIKACWEPEPEGP